ncbi:MAG: hypothetical protein H6867_05310 [Rhodospirillales bacterium]|nr:hypothetical protein [Rhodospirillales bacterium]MCB9994947.1 hypothetical protein [Rhodospirillales bacterium]
MKKAHALIIGSMLLCGSFALQVPAQASGLDVPCTHYDDMTLEDFLLEDFMLTQGGPPEGKRPEGHMKRPPRGDGPGEFDDRWQDKREKMQERIERMPPEQQEQARQRIEEMQQKREALREELESLPPEERKARMEELREQFESEHAQRREKLKQKFEERWDHASEEERASFCENARSRCADGGEKACAFAARACGE